MVWTPLHAELHKLLRSPPFPLAAGALLPQGAAVLVAVSGGQDSLCLLRLLVDLQPKWGWTLQGWHGNHRWRSDAAANADFVHTLAADWGVPCRVDTAAIAPTSEAAARTWRYRTLAEAAQAQGCTHIVTGHTASDRAETLLHNLMRGSAANGLQALTWCRPLSPAHPDLALVRPLLGLTRQQTATFCQQQQLPIWVDSTNTDRAYTRNRIRLDVLPQLQAFNPQVDRTLAHTAEVLTAEVAYLEEQCDRLAPTCVQWHPPQLQRRVLATVPLALQRRLVRRFLQRLVSHPTDPQQAVPAQTAPERAGSAPVSSGQIGFDHVEKVVALIAAPNRSQSDPFPGGAIAQVRGDWIIWHPPSSR